MEYMPIGAFSSLKTSIHGSISSEILFTRSPVKKITSDPCWLTRFTACFTGSGLSKLPECISDIWVIFSPSNSFGRFLKATSTRCILKLYFPLTTPYIIETNGMPATTVANWLIKRLLDSKNSTGESVFDANLYTPMPIALKSRYISSPSRKNENMSLGTYKSTKAAATNWTINDVCLAEKETVEMVYITQAINARLTTQ